MLLCVVFEHFHYIEDDFSDNLLIPPLCVSEQELLVHIALSLPFVEGTGLAFQLVMQLHSVSSGSIDQLFKLSDFVLKVGLFPGKVLKLLCHQLDILHR